MTFLPEVVFYLDERDMPAFRDIGSFLNVTELW